MDTNARTRSKKKEIEQDKEFCEVGEHYVDKEDHWKNNGHPLCGDCMNCTNEKELEELGLIVQTRAKWDIVKCNNGVGVFELTYEGENTGDTFDTEDECWHFIKHQVHLNMRQEHTALEDVKSSALTRQSKRQSKDLEDALARIKILEGKLLGVLAKNKLASKREGAVNIGHDKLTNIAAAVLSLELDLEGDCPDNIDEVLYDKWHDSFINLLEEARCPPNLNPNIAWFEDDKYIDSHRDDAEVYLAYKRMVLNLGELSTFVFRLFPEYKDDDVWRTKSSIEDRLDLVKNHVHKTIPLRRDDNSDQSSDDDNKVGDFPLSCDSDNKDSSSDNDALSEKDTTEGDSSSKEASPSEYSDSSASSESSDDDDVDDDKPRTMDEFLDLRKQLYYDEARQLQEDVRRKMKDVTNNEEVEKLRKEFREKLADLTRWVKGDITTIVVAFQNASSTSSSESSDDEFDVDELDQAAAADHYEGMAMRTRGAVALALVVVLAVAVALARQSKP